MTILCAPDRSAPGVRRDAWQHGGPSGYRLGCHCAPCYRARWAYDELRRAGGSPRVERTVVAAHVRALLADGWTRTAIVAEAGISPGTLRNVERGNRPRVNSRTAESLLSLPVASARQERPVQPLWDALAARYRARGLAPAVSATDRRVLYRARQRGVVDDRVADRLAITYLGVPLELIYDDAEAAA